MKTPGAEKDEERELTFDDAYRELEKIVSLLESGRGGLEDSLVSYERGVELVRLCRRKLEGAARRIELLKGVDEDGELKTEKLDESVLGEESTSAGRQHRASSKNASAKSEVSRSETPQSQKPSEPETPNATEKRARSETKSRASSPSFFPDFDGTPPF